MEGVDLVNIEPAGDCEQWSLAPTMTPSDRKQHHSHEEPNMHLAYRNGQLRVRMEGGYVRTRLTILCF